MVLKKNKNIQEFLGEKKFEKCYNIKINWILYSDNDLIYYDNRTVQERFTKPLIKDSENKHIKSTVRGHLKKNYWESMWQPHSSNAIIESCIPTGKKTDAKSPFHTPPNFEVAYIKHFATKTIEEYISKIKRGRSDFKVTINYDLWKRKLAYFFGRNKKTKKKLDYIKKALNIVFK